MKIDRRNPLTSLAEPASSARSEAAGAESVEAAESGAPVEAPGLEAISPMNVEQADPLPPAAADVAARVLREGLQGPERVRAFVASALGDVGAFEGLSPQVRQQVEETLSEFLADDPTMNGRIQNLIAKLLKNID